MKYNIGYHLGGGAQTKHRQPHSQLSFYTLQMTNLDLFPKNETLNLRLHEDEGT